MHRVSRKDGIIEILKYQIMAMSVMASGAVKPEEAFEFIGRQKIDSVVFGASSQKNIIQSTELIKNLEFRI